MVGEYIYALYIARHVLENMEGRDSYQQQISGICYVREAKRTR